MDTNERAREVIARATAKHAGDLPCSDDLEYADAILSALAEAGLRLRYIPELDLTKIASPEAAEPHQTADPETTDS